MGIVAEGGEGPRGLGVQGKEKPSRSKCKWW